MRTFRGGIHPKGNKKQTASKPIVDLAPTEELVYPLSQHIGAPAVPCVKAGDSVLMGQKIAEANGFISAHIHRGIFSLSQRRKKFLAFCRKSRFLRFW